MGQPAVVFDGVWKKFRRGERHDSLRDLLPAMIRGAFGRKRAAELGDQEFWAVKDVSFEVQPGEAFGIIGPNGAGKSTALKLLTKILKPTRGHCEVHGRVGALIEVAAGFHPDLTGRENVFLQGAVMGMKPAEIKRQFDAIVDFSALSEFIDTPVKRYSSGMNARLGFSIAAHLDPEVLIIDEVLAVGDFTFQQKCYERLAAFRDAGVPILLVSHNLQAVSSLCRRAVLLRPGEPQVVGPAAEVAALCLGGPARSSDGRAQLQSVQLNQIAGNVPVSRPIAPGVPLRLDLEIRSSDPLPRCGIGVQVVRSDGHEVFSGASNIDVPSGVDVQAHDTLHASLTLHPHLLRGVYVINVRLLDTHRIWPIVTFHGVASFVIEETTRVAGCADLYPTYSLQSHSSQTSRPPEVPAWS